MWLFGNSKIQGRELEECLAYFEAEYKLITFQTRETDRCNVALKKFGSAIMNNVQAAQEACKATRRLSQSAQEILKRHYEIETVPARAILVFTTWSYTFSAYASWAKVAHSEVEAMANGQSENINYFEQFASKCREMQRSAEEENKKFLVDLNVNRKRINQIMNRVSLELTRQLEPRDSKGRYGNYCKRESAKHHLTLGR